MTADLSAGEPRWDWDTTFLWAGTVAIRKEVIGALPDGLQINWQVTEGRNFVRFRTSRGSSCRAASTGCASARTVLPWST